MPVVRWTSVFLSRAYRIVGPIGAPPAHSESAVFEVFGSAGVDEIVSLIRVGMRARHIDSTRNNITSNDHSKSYVIVSSVDHGSVC